MVISANLLSPRLKLRIGKNQYEITNVWQTVGLVRVEYKGSKGISKTKTYDINAQLNIV
jgi:hypothetical protein